jgi:hypothetical protein
MRAINSDMLDELFELLRDSLWPVHLAKRDDVIQAYAYRLSTVYNISPRDLRESLGRLGMTLQECCSGCNLVIDKLDKDGNAICEECHKDIDSVG